MGDNYIENGHRKYHQRLPDEENQSIEGVTTLGTEFGIKCITEADAARLQEILTVNECLKWDVAFRQFWEKRGQPLNPKGFNRFKYGSQGRPLKDNFKEEDKDYEESLIRVD